MFDEFIQSDEFATSWEEYQRYLDDLWEEPDEWRQVDTLAQYVASSSSGKEAGFSIQ